MYELIITLKSDLCAADGDGCAAAIDTDVCVDKNGFPVIPARRLKGCLKEAAKVIGVSEGEISGIFGESGSASGCPLHISDAVLPNAAELAESAKNEGVPPSKVTDLYTTVRASTAIDEATGAARDQSLRFARAVKHYDPLGGGELEFRAAVSIPKGYEDQFKSICRALRNIGYKRSRGFGAVSCRLDSTIEPAENKNPEISADFFTPDKEYVISYTVKLIDDVMISGATSDESVDFIPGASLLGFFANEYLRKHSADAVFEELFLKNGVSFSNLYISDSSGAQYIPAPVVLGKIKGVENVVNIIEEDKKDGEKPFIKPLKSGYTDKSLNVITPLTETVYHISRGETTDLYMQTAIRKGQYFSGTISGKGKFLAYIYKIMKGGVIRVGRSKTAQYSTCAIVSEAVHAAPKESDTINIKKGEVFIAALTSDMLISNGMGGYASDMDTLVDLLAEKFGFDCKTVDKNLKLKRSALKYRSIHGYNTQWNLKKPHIRAVAAGSAAIFTADRDYTLPAQLQFGEKRGEGFGFVKLLKSAELVYIPQNPPPENPASEHGGLFSKAIRMDKMRTDALNYAAKTECALNGSQLGIAMLMAKEAESYSDFKSRVNNREKEFGEYFKTDLFDYYPDYWREFAILIILIAKYKIRAAKGAGA